MGESVNIAKMAEILADTIFGEFFWGRVGTTNQDWPCEKEDEHDTKTHPVDAVFFYDEPYAQVRTYVHCDLKSYAKSSITRSSVRKAIESLARQIECAEISKTWADRYIHQHVTAAICGLLFVYNHDGEYDLNFDDHLNAVKSEDLAIPEGSKIVVLGPKQIFWLDNVCREITMLRGKSGPHRLPDREHCRYFYPQLDRRLNIQLQKARAATLEVLTAPWILLEYKADPSKAERGFVVFLNRPGKLTQEFIYLIDYLRHYQILDENTRVRIKAFNPDAASSAAFQKAQQQYIEQLSKGGEESPLAERIAEIGFEVMNQINTKFSDIEIGMDYD